MNTFQSFIVSAAVAASTLGFVALSTSAQAGISTCGAWRCGYNGIDLNGLSWNGAVLNGISMQGTALGGVHAGGAIAVTLPSGETVSLR